MRGTILALDPGYEQTAWVEYDPNTSQPVGFGLEPNAAVLLALGSKPAFGGRAMHLVVEGVASYGMAVGAEVFDTVFWTGRFVQAWAIAQRRPWARVYRRAVKLHICASPKATDSNIRAAILDRYGPGRAKAVGTKHARGPLYGMKADTWAALAVAITFHETAAAETLQLPE